MSGLGLVPNKVIGYRIKADWHSFNPVLVKEHGPESKNAGQQYETTLGYCKDIPSACRHIINHYLRVQGIESQAATAEATGEVASLQALSELHLEATRQAVAAAKDLERRILAAGLLKKDLVMGLGDAPGETEPLAV